MGTQNQSAHLVDCSLDGQELIVHIQVFVDSLHHALGIIGIVDGKATRIADFLRPAAQDAYTGRVEGGSDTWMRQPHYYMGLYSYTYSAGLTVATQVCKRIETEGQTAVDDWKKVLTAGSTKTPEELAKMAGVDISTDAPLLDTIETIGSIIDEICELTEELGC